MTKQVHGNATRLQEDVDARFGLFLMCVMLVLKATSSDGSFDERWQELCGHVRKVEILKRILSERKLETFFSGGQKDGIKNVLDEREKRVGEEGRQDQ